MASPDPALGGLPRVSIIVPIFNGAHVLPETLSAFVHQDVPTELLFVDDASTDATPRLLRACAAEHPHARVLTHPENRGRAAARNTGADAASGDVLLFFDADVRPAPDCARQHAALYRDGAVVGGVSHPTLQGLDADDPYGQYLQTRRGAAAVGAGRPLPFRLFIIGYTSVRANALRAVGGFDERLRYGEDLDLAYRLWRRHPEGLRFAADARVGHFDHGTLDDRLVKLRQFGRETLPLLFHKHPGLAEPAGLAFVDSSPRSGGTWALLGRLIRPAPAALVRASLPVLPRTLRPLAVRYVLAAAVAEGYRAAD